MSSAFIATAITAWRGCLRTELVAGFARAQELKSLDELDQEYIDQFDKETLDVTRDMLAAAFAVVIDDYDDGAESVHFDLDMKEIMFTGGMSWGDPPTEVGEAMNRVLSCGLYWGDRLSPEQESLKKRIVENVKAVDSEYAVWLQDNLDDLIHQLQIEVAAQISSEGWEHQLDHLFERYGDSVMDFFKEYVREEVLEVMLKK